MFTDFQEIRPHYRLSIEVFMPIPMRRFGVFGMGVVRKRILGWQCPLVSGKCDTLAVCVMMESDQAPAPASDDGVRPSSEHWAHPGTHEQSVAARPHTSSRVTDSMKFFVFSNVIKSMSIWWVNAILWGRYRCCFLCLMFGISTHVQLFY